jgi:hypothetical protein
VGREVMGSQSDAVILLWIFAFYTFIFFMLGLIGGFTVSKIDSPTETHSLDFWDYVGFFFQGIFFSIAEMGMFNFILFTPLALTLLYLLAKLIRGGG